MGSQTILPAMVRAYIGSTLCDSTEAGSAPQAINASPAAGKRHVLAQTPLCPPPLPTIATVPHETIFQKTMKGFTDAKQETRIICEHPC